MTLRARYLYIDTSGQYVIILRGIAIGGGLGLRGTLPTVTGSNMTRVAAERRRAL
jgi:hypothetical protein